MLLRASWLYGLYAVQHPRWRALVRRVVTRFEGGEMYSHTLRRIFAEYHGINVGLYSYGCFAPERIPAGTTVGRYCSFAGGVAIFDANHPMERASLHPFFYNPRLGVVAQETVSRHSLTVGHDAWIGHNAVIAPRVLKVGNGAVVGAGAVVTKDVPAYAVVVGNPARIIKYRFSEGVQRCIEASRWWERSIAELRQNLDAFLRPASTWCNAPLVNHPFLVAAV